MYIAYIYIFKLHNICIHASTSKFNYSKTKFTATATENKGENN